MNGTLKKILLVGILIPAPTYWLVAENFVVQKQKKVSASDLKTDCFHELKQALELCPDALRGIADIQELGMTTLASMVEGDFFKDMDKVTLEKELLEIQQYLENQQEINELVRKQVTFLQIRKNKNKK